ncbi:MAG: hypothetical protein MZW92_48565 [Comamonadaceae bacterium]|nr:hypothetical protein [Comamonadaceae bacterium]
MPPAARRRTPPGSGEGRSPRRGARPGIAPGYAPGRPGCTVQRASLRV